VLVGEDLLEAEAIEETAGPGDAVTAEVPRPLPERSRGAEISLWRDEVRSAAIAAAGGIVVGAATVAAVRAGRAAGQARRRVGRRSRERMPGVVASRSFLIDVHVLER
jgi:hypothetical protein